MLFGLILLHSEFLFYQNTHLKQKKLLKVIKHIRFFSNAISKREIEYCKKLNTKLIN